jgi:enamine deaminase RidA (YjgF/YER057c/UK114 family)
MGGFRHFMATGIDGRGSNGQLSTGFRDQSDSMFGRADELLSRHGIPFQNVLRTWCYLDDIDRDYAEFNLSRNAFFEKTEISRLPASTGIRAGLKQGALCSVDLYALMDMEGAQVEIMCTPTLNEAPEYGSSFSRGMKLSLPEKTVLFISGTASVDEQGDTVHVDDLTKQIQRMLLNVKELLAPHGASFADLAQVITYLKHASYLEPFLDVWKQTGPADMPNSIVEAGVCRPDLLCEMEGIAVLPTS